jgi:hypothetical protein
MVTQQTCVVSTKFALFNPRHGKRIIKTTAFWELYIFCFFLVMGVSFVFCISGVLAICHFWHLDGAALLSFAAHASGALPFTDASQTQPPRTSRFGGFDVVAETNRATEALVKPLSGHPAFPPILVSGPGRNLG